VINKGRTVRNEVEAATARESRRNVRNMPAVFSNTDDILGEQKHHIINQLVFKLLLFKKEVFIISYTCFTWGLDTLMLPITVHGVICNLQLSAYVQTIVFMTQRTPKKCTSQLLCFHSCCFAPYEMSRSRIFRVAIDGPAASGKSNVS
jgi:hypothetical protein